VSVDRDDDPPNSFEDWREAFQSQARRARKLHESVACLGLVLVLGLFASVLFLSHPNRYPWYWAFVAAGIGVLILVWLRPAPWPRCPACSGTFRRLGAFCPHCGVPLPADATPKRAACPACGYCMCIVAKAPCYREKYHMSSDYKFRLVPVRYCTHCRARLG
jgi:hypothetical protein